MASSSAFWMMAGGKDEYKSVNRLFSSQTNVDQDEPMKPALKMRQAIHPKMPLGHFSLSTIQR